MLKSADITLSEQCICLSGDLHFSNVMSLLEKSVPLMNQSKNWVFDFSKVTSSDSSGLALVIEWVKRSKCEGKPILFKHLSRDLMSIAEAANMTQLIGGA